MKQLHARWGERVQFVDVEIRQAHPGPGASPYHSLNEKKADAEHYQHENSIAWPVLVDDLQGTVHQLYSGLADPTYLIDADGRVAYVNMWTHVPTLHAAIENLLTQGERGIVDKGWDRRPRLGPALTDGWKGLRRGLPQSLIDIETTLPGAGIGPWLGYQVRPVLAPITLRATPLPATARVALNTVGLIVLALVLLWLINRARHRR